MTNPISSSPAESEESLSTTIYLDLRAKLITGVLQPSEPVSIRKFADAYGVSAMPVREALRQLASEGALTSAARKAFRVPDLTSQEASDLFFVRGVLEAAAVEIAAQTITSKALTRLDKFVTQMQTQWEARNASGFLLANYKFHSTIYQSTKNHALAANIDRLYVQTGPWLFYGIVNLVDPDNWLGEHGLMVDALRARDGNTARKLMEEDAAWGVEVYRHLK